MMADQKILHASAKLFMTKGFHGTSIRDIAVCAGVNSSMISYYFRSKENVFIQLIKQIEEALREIYTVACKYRNKRQKLFVFYKCIYDYCKQHVETLPLFNQQLILSNYPKIQKQYHSLFNAYKEMFGSLTEVDFGNIEQKNPQIYLIFMTVTGFINSSLVNGKFQKDQDIYHHLKLLISICI